MGRSDADVLKDISAMESAAVQEKADKLLAAKKAEAELALQTRSVILAHHNTTPIVTTGVTHG